MTAFSMVCLEKQFNKPQRFNLIESNYTAAATEQRDLQFLWVFNNVKCNASAVLSPSLFDL